MSCQTLYYDHILTRELKVQLYNDLSAHYNLIFQLQRLFSQPCLLTCPRSRDPSLQPPSSLKMVH